MAIRSIQGLLLEDGEPFRVNGSVFVLDGGAVVSQAHYEGAKNRPRPLCAICDTDKEVHICESCSKRLFTPTAG